MRPGYSKVERWFTISCFLLTLAAGLLSFFVLPTATVSKAENRPLAAWPKWDWTLGSLQKMPASIDAYLKDHFAARDPLITFHSLLNFKVFNASVSQRVKIGKEGWLFIQDELDRAQPLTALQLDQLKRDIREKKEWLNKRGIEFLFVLVPDKIAIYPEYLPDSLRPQQGPVRVANIKGAFKAEGLEVIDLEPLLKRKKKKEQLFFETDTHWNYFGSYLGYRAIMRRVEELFPDLHPLLLGKDLMLKKTTRQGGDLAKMLGIQSYISEVNYNLPDYQW